MKLNPIFATLALTAAVSNAFAFSSIKIAFPEGIPDKLTMAYKVSMGKCGASSAGFDCQTSTMSQTYKLNVPGALSALEEDLEFFSTTFKGKLVENHIDSPSNYMKLSIPGQPNICYVDLLKNKADILVNINKDGSCPQ